MLTYVYLPEALKILQQKRKAVHWLCSVRMFTKSVLCCNTRLTGLRLYSR